MWRRQVERPKSDSGGEGTGSKWSELNLVELEAEAFLLGHWKNFDELEEALTVAELNAILEAARQRQEREWRFAASLQGVKLPESSDNEDPVERAKRRAAAERAGVTEEQLSFADIGIEVEYI